MVSPSGILKLLDVLFHMVRVRARVRVRVRVS